MAPKLYKMDLSPPARAVFLTAEALGVELEHVEINFLQREQMTPEFQKLNSQHTIPTLEDDGKVIWDSHAIITYLALKYGKDDSLYPKDLHKKAVIDQRLHFDSGILFPLIRRTAGPIFMKGVKTIPNQLKEEIIQAYEFLEKFLEGHQWAAGDQITLADFSLLSSITSLDCLVPIDSSTFSNISNWIKRAQQLPYYGANQKGLDDFKALVKKNMST